MKRRFPRLTVRVDVRIDTPRGPLEATATTLGAGGLFVATPAPLPARTPVTVRLRLPGEDVEVCFDARVVWCVAPGAGVASPGMGLEFENAEARSEHAARLEAWAERRDGR
jgi:uncharacterized protein (TIGR02266 family)